GTEFVSPPSPVETPPRWDKIATIETEVEAERLEVDLKSREIPHVMRSYRDAAFDGIFQTMRGWGHVEGPAEEREAILTVLKDIRQSSSESASAESDEVG